jgi:hypothetical protein
LILHWQVVHQPFGNAQAAGHPSPFQPPLKGYRCFCGHLLHRNVHGSILPGHGPMSGIVVQLPGPQQAKEQSSLYKDQAIGYNLGR